MQSEKDKEKLGEGKPLLQIDNQSLLMLNFGATSFILLLFSMAEILPFRGLVYNLKKVGDLSSVTAPPYDVISEKAKPKYYARHPYNVIRLELGDESSGQERYRLCAQYLDDWERRGIFIREREPAFYYYQVDFPSNKEKIKTRRGFIGLCRLEESGKKMILPHERIHEEQKEDRLRVLKACQANISQIFSLYSDTHHTIQSLFEKYLSNPPLFNYFDEENIRHTLWSIKDQSLHRQVRERMKEKVLFIADGHHRFEAALAYKKEREKKSSSFTGKEPFLYTMMYFCPFEDEGLTILPSHRLIFNLSQFDRGDFELELEKYFQKTNYPFTPQNEGVVRINFLQKLEEARRGNALGLYIHGNYYYTLLHLKKESDLPDRVGKDIPTVLQKLDVFILHRLILEHLLGIEEKEQDQHHVQIIKNGQRAIDMVREGTFQMVFLLNPTKAEEVQKVALEGEFMPQKSTFFYPKLPTGLVINKIVEDETIDDLIS
jgi:uncharacterized protein (DUF1015 family)